MSEYPPFSSFGNQPTPWNRDLENGRIFYDLKNASLLIETESSLQCSQKLVSSLYPELGTSSPRPSILLLFYFDSF
jgi:hypothetical protein